MGKNEISVESGRKIEPAFAPEWLKNSFSAPGFSIQTPDDHCSALTAIRTIKTRNCLSFNREKVSGNLEISKNSEKELLRRSQSMITGRVSPGWANKTGSDGVHHGISNGNTSFEREFPHLGAEERPPEISRVSSPGLNMAKALVQAPVRSGPSPKEADDNIRLEEFEIKMSRRLIPVTPASPKILNGKRRGSRTADQKVGQQTQTETGAISNRGLIKPDMPKTPQVRNFQVLNREKNTVLRPGARYGLILPDLIPPKSARHAKSNGKPGAQQNRMDFFNSLRKKTSESSTVLVSLGKSEEPITRSGSSPTSESKSWIFDPAAEERLLHLLGWKEDAEEGDEGLTAAEIDAFISEYEKRRPSSESCQRSFLLAKAMLSEMGGGAC